MTTKALSSSGGLNNPTNNVGFTKSLTNRSESPNRMNKSCAVMRSYASFVLSSFAPKQSIVASNNPTIDALSESGMRSNRGNVARTCPRGDGSCGKESWEGKKGKSSLAVPNTGAVASSPSGE
eukprot:CAMPEP_0172488672 /NCGR_PEP_ID=MMETSP1066-20121228/18313_1 /TAXON_ID=671091 /ORGANISM="Coscinodiscus wailesii, Strain CCMP2513" /LENGTH=122 /DNA_ID=CAMNT_0013256043 /DNA_START=239 /DNA_END=607 /DNA_ORIENTATION=-